MSRVYRVHERLYVLEEGWQGLVVLSIVATLFLLFAVGAVGWGLGVLIAMSAVVPFFLLGLHAYSRWIWQIHVTPDGRLDFLRVRGSRSVMARDIRRVVGFKPTDPEGPDAWTMRIWHTGGVTEVEWFDQAPEFVSHITSLNPYIEVDIDWPPSVPHGRR